jgi:ATP synthase protein I
MAQGDEPPSFGDFDERLKRLRGTPEEGVRGQVEAEPPSMRLSDGFQAGVEVIAGVGGGALIGYGLDYWLGTAPFLLIVCFVLGAAAGVLNAYRTLRRFMGRTQGDGTG